ncbi:hypothetical protein SCA6_006064 [Theobroma cacao]
MITTKKLIRMARKWQKTAAIGRKRITSARTNYKKMAAVSHSKQSSVVEKGYFVIYTIDERRFVIPLAFLRNSIFQELLKMSEEEFGLPSDGPITLPCDAVVMNYIISLVKRGLLAKDLERADMMTNSHLFGHADQTGGGSQCPWPILASALRQGC